MSTPQDGGPIASGIEMQTQGESQRLTAIGGLSMRDWFAGMAIPATIEWLRLREKEEIFDDGFNKPHHQPCLPDHDSRSPNEIAICCYAIAEAMISHRKELE